MKKIICLLLCLLMVGCSKEENKIDDLKILTPNGTPAISLVEYVNKYGFDNITIVEGSDLLQASLVNVDSEYDVIIAPINLGCKLINQNNSDYKLLGVITWGNLYVVENKGIEEGEFALFGESAIPGKIIKDVTDYDGTWYSAVSDVSAALLSGKAKFGLLAEPVLTTTLNKASANNIDLEIATDLNMIYNEKYQTLGYPQAALFVSNKVMENKKDQLDNLLDCLENVNKESMNLLSQYEDFYAIKDASLIYEAFERMNIYYVNVEDYKKEITTFLELFGIEDYKF